MSTFLKSANACSEHFAALFGHWVSPKSTLQTRLFCWEVIEKSCASQRDALNCNVSCRSFFQGLNASTKDKCVCATLELVLRNTARRKTQNVTLLDSMQLQQHAVFNLSCLFRALQAIANLSNQLAIPEKVHVAVLMCSASWFERMWVRFVLWKWIRTSMACNLVRRRWCFQRMLTHNPILDLCLIWQCCRFLSCLLQCWLCSCSCATFKLWPCIQSSETWRTPTTSCNASDPHSGSWSSHFPQTPSLDFSNSVALLRTGDFYDGALQLWEAESAQGYSGPIGETFRGRSGVSSARYFCP